MKKIIEQLEQLISINSISSLDPAIDRSNAEIIYLLADWLEDLHFKIEIIPTDASPGKLNLIAKLGPGEKGLIFSGHTDTVACDPRRWQTDPFQLTQKNARLFGLGVCDMKSFFPLVLEACKQTCAQIKQEPAKPICIVATSDEEISMKGMRTLLKSNLLQGEFAVIGEPTSLTPVHTHKGILMLTIILRGKSGHSSNPSLGNSALEGMVEVIGKILELRKKLQEENLNQEFSVPFPTINLGRIQGGDIANRICGNCELSLDIRILPGMKNHAVLEGLYSAIGKIAKTRKLDFEVATIFDAVEPLNTDKQSKFVTCLEGITNQRSMAVNYATEAPFFQQMRIATAILGAGNIKQAHKANESISIKSLKMGVKIYQEIIRKFCFAE